MSGPFHMSLRFACLLVVMVCLVTPCLGQGQASGPPSPVEVWLADIIALDQSLRQHHPNAFFRSGEGNWLEGLGAARELIALGAPDEKIATALMSAVARLGDGHTRLEPTGIEAFANWLPLRFYAFDDGVFVTVAAEPYAGLIGKKLLNVEETSVGDALGLVAGATAGDNEFQKVEGAAALLSNTGLLSALGVTADASGPVTLGFEDSNGSNLSRTVGIVNSWYSVNYRNWGELFGPPFEPFDVYKTPFHGGKSPMEYRNTPATNDAPFYASRMPFWARLNTDQTILTFQFNYFADIGEIGWDDFRHQMWDLLDETQPQRFIIDLRYNFGGNGEMVRALINELLARPDYANDNRLVVLTGRQTFSAAVMLLAALKDHTDAVFIGEPAGAPLNHYGDPITVTLPSGRLELVVSTLYWQLGHPSDRTTVIPVDVCVPTRARDYFAGVDAVWEAAVRIDIAQARATLAPRAGRCILR